MDRIIIGDRIRECRERKKLTQTELAELAHISVRSLSDIENGKVSPKCENVVNISKALNEPLADLVIGITDRKGNSFFNGVIESIVDFTDEDLQCLMRIIQFYKTEKSLNN